MNTVSDSMFEDPNPEDIQARPLDLVDVLNNFADKLDPQIDDLAGALERAPAEMHTFTLPSVDGKRPKPDVDRVMALVAALRNLKNLLDDSKKAINRIATKVEQHGCNIILDEDELIWRTELGSFSPRPRGFFGVKDAEEFLEHLDGDIPTLCKLMKSKTALNEYCEDLLTNGEPMPPGVSSHLDAKIHFLRRK